MDLILERRIDFELAFQTKRDLSFKTERIKED